MSIKSFFPQNIKNYYHLFQAVMANVFYGFPSKKIKIIGVTGTNGKTTTVQLVTKILEESGVKVAMASTINFKLGQREWVNKTKFTTLSAFSVQKFIRRAVGAKCEYLILETSSHSLDQYRVWGVEYDTAVITNVTREHLDYHKDMDSYRMAKLKLFSGVKNSVVNLDMERPEDYLDCRAKKIYAYTTKNQDKKNILHCEHANLEIVEAKNIELGIGGSSYEVGGAKFKLHLPGEFNVENALAAACVGLVYRVSLEKIRTALEKVTGVLGRMEKVENNLGLEIIIDYALTPDSLEKLYSLISKAKKLESKIIAVFGSCGDRDRGKRPIMGEIVSGHADYVIVTNEDPYNEDPMQIINEVASGVKNKTEGENFWKIFDRREAIARALKLAKAGDVIVVTGKGAEEVMLIGKKRILWNDRTVITEELARI